ncbi:PPE domain-containing protein [Mycobacterium lepromatosis]|uniref:PPE domain-containing protein n=1 Tax=Mycobacterium lepromatosis TaxID=480418 RepID=UPI0006973875
MCVLLNSGFGSAGLLVGTNGWRLLSAEYISAADEFIAIVAAARVAGWEGCNRRVVFNYAAEHALYAAWLTQAGINSARMCSIPGDRGRCVHHGAEGDADLDGGDRQPCD